MSLPASTADRSFFSATASRTFQRLFWVLGLVITPLSLGPGSLLSGGRVGYLQTPAFRALLLAVVVVVGIITVVATTNVSSRQLFSWGRGQVRWLLPLLGLISWLLIAIPIGNVGLGIPALGSWARYDGAGIQALWFALVPIGAVMARFGTIEFRVIARYALATGLVTSLWTLFQGIGVDPVRLILVGEAVPPLPSGAFGHGAQASTFVAIALLLSYGLWFNRVLSPVVLSSVFVMGAGMAAAGGRAGMFAWGVMTCVLLLGLIKHRPKRTAILILVFVTLLGAAAAYYVIPRAQQQALRASTAILGGDTSLNNRFPAWRGGVALLAEYPLFGVGAEGYMYGVWNHVTDDDKAQLIRAALGSSVSHLELQPHEYTIAGDMVMYLDSEGRVALGSVRWDKAHNFLLDLGLTAGLPAVLLFLAFVGFALLDLIRSSEALIKSISYGLGVFLIYGFFWFGMISLDPVVWLLVGSGLGWRSRQKAGAQVSESVVAAVGTTAAKMRVSRPEPKPVRGNVKSL